MRKQKKTLLVFTKLHMHGVNHKSSLVGFDITKT